MHDADPSFPKPFPGFKNGSVRKCHTYILNMAMLPASVQRRSVGHKQGSNYWASTYNNPNDPTVRNIVAETIASKVALPEPDSSTHTPTRSEPPVTRSASKRAAQSDTIPANAPKRSLNSSMEAPNTNPVYKAATISFTPHDASTFELPIPSGTQGQLVLPGGITITFSVN